MKKADKAAPKINSGATDGGYFIGRPMDPESRPVKTKKAKPSHESGHMGWAGDKPTKACVEKGPARRGVLALP